MKINIISTMFYNNLIRVYSLWHCLLFHINNVATLSIQFQNGKMFICILGYTVQMTVKHDINKIYKPIALDTANCPLTLHIPQNITQPPFASIRSFSS